jgi:hypothetical protein
MLKIKDWTASQAKDIVFVYGEFDPWTAGAYPNGQAENNVHHFVVKGGNHGSKFNLLDLDQRSKAENIFAAWFRKAPLNAPVNGKKDLKMKVNGIKTDIGEDLETFEFRVRRSLRL